MRKNVWLVAGAFAAAALAVGCSHEYGRIGARSIHAIQTRTCHGPECRNQVPVRVINGNSCVVGIEFQTLIAPPGNKPKIVWELVKVAGDPVNYRFNEQTGVFIRDNNPELDFFNGGTEERGQRYRWFDKHERARTFKYDVNVQYQLSSTSPGPNPNPWTDCGRLDPIFINE